VVCDDRHVPQTVLIVDDHDRLPGFRPPAARGWRSLAAVERLRPELVLLDVMLPDTDGFAVAEQLAGNGGEPVVVVVLTSSREAADFGQRLERTSARGFIHKDQLVPAPLVCLAEAPG
jgi:CheY-like chemotaxis protein